jgi:hypothetical protein
MQIKVLIQVEPSNRHSFEIGCLVNGGDIHSWTGYWPSSFSEGVTSALKLLKQDYTKTIVPYIKYGGLLLNNLKFKIMDSNEFIRDNKRFCLLTLTAVSLIGIETINRNSFSALEYSSSETHVSRLDSAIYGKANNTADIAKVSPKALKKAAKVERKSTAVKRHAVVTIPVVRKTKLRPVSSHTMSAFQQVLDKELNSSISNIKAETYVKLLLNLSEGYYPVPYWDNKQYSVGFGAYISRGDCEKMWIKMGLSVDEGNKLAWRLHDLGKINYKKAKALSDSWIGKPGTMTLSQAEDARDKEFQGFLRSVKKQYPELSYWKQLVLASTVYNTGWAGYLGGKFDGKIFPESALAKCLRTKDYDSIKWAYMRLKTHTKGHYNRRQREMRAFLAFDSTEERRKTIGHLTEAMAFDKTMR